MSILCAAQRQGRGRLEPSYLLELPRRLLLPVRGRLEARRAWPFYEGSSAAWAGAVTIL